MTGTRRQRIMWWMHDDRRSDRLYDNGFTRAVARVCCAVWGHDPHPDNCGLPEHDLCIWCARSMPGQAPRRARS